MPVAQSRREVARLPVGVLVVACAVAAAVVAAAVPAQAQVTMPVDILHRLDYYGREGRSAGPLVEAPDGSLYGLMRYGGDPADTYCCGTVIRTGPGGGLSVVYRFSLDRSEGEEPAGPLILANDGYLYGTAARGGSFGLGTVFRLLPDGSGFGVVHHFSGLDGSHPSAGVLQASDGQLYGTTQGGGAAARGTAFRLGLDGVLATLHHFAGGDLDAAYPDTPLIEVNGWLFGTGTGDFQGWNYRLHLDGRVERLRVVSTSDGDYSQIGMPGVTRSRDGNLYGLTRNSGKGAIGSFYRLSPAGTFTVLRTFRWSELDIRSELTEAADDTFYALGANTVFRLARDGSILHVQNVRSSTPLRQAADGALYGLGDNEVIRIWPFLNTAPTQFRSRRQVSRVGLTWSPVDGAASYRIKRGTVVGREVVIADVTATSYTDGEVIPGTTYFYLVSVLVNGMESADSLRLVVTVAPAASAADFDGDGKAELGLFQPDTGTWALRSSIDGYNSGPDLPFGIAGDHAVPGDYDGDGRNDLAVQRPSDGTWYVMLAGTGAIIRSVLPGMPVVADYTGDGQTDIAVWDQYSGIWYIEDLSTGIIGTRQWGVYGDVPMPADYDRDGKADVAVFRPSNGTWHVFFSSTQTYAAYQWGISGDVPLPADYTGDGVIDLAVYRPSTGQWFIYDLRSATYSAWQWGASTDTPVPADYDGDGKTDLAVWRPSGHWFIYYMGTNTGQAVTHGAPGDVPIR